jgi:hypothetical protein
MKLKGRRWENSMSWARRLNLSAVRLRLKMILIIISNEPINKISKYTAMLLTYLRYVKCTLVQSLRLCKSRTAHRGSRGIALPFLDHGTRRGWGGQLHAPAALYLRERPGTHCTGGWVSPRAGLDERKISPPPGFDPRTVQPVVSRYTDWATRPTLTLCTRKKICLPNWLFIVMYSNHYCLWAA